MVLRESVQRGGPDRLVWDCATIDRVLHRRVPSASARLEREVGEWLAMRLLRALAGGCSYQQARSIDLRLTAHVAGAVGLQGFGSGVILPLHRGRSTAVVSSAIGRKHNRGVTAVVSIAQVRASKAAWNKERARSHPLTADAPVIELACECVDPSCAETVVLTEEELAFLKSVPSYFTVCPGHVAPDDHVLIAEGDRVAIVE